jgi:hypothetical protein
LSTQATAGRRAEIPEPNITRFLFADTRMAPVWLVVRVCLGMFILVTWLVLTWRVAGHWGLDRWILPATGVPGAAGTLFRSRTGEGGQSTA